MRRFIVTREGRVFIAIHSLTIRRLFFAFAFVQARDEAAAIASGVNPNKKAKRNDSGSTSKFKL
jgi:hypothetical protein